MGQCLSLYVESRINPVNDDNSVNVECPVCNKKQISTNLTGRFIIINETECKCNSCNTIFPKSQFYN